MVDGMRRDSVVDSVASRGTRSGRLHLGKGDGTGGSAPRRVEIDRIDGVGQLVEARAADDGDGRLWSVGGLIRASCAAGW